MKQPNMQWAKGIPFLFIVVIVAAVVMGIVNVTSRPDVIKAKAEWAKSAADLWIAKNVFYQQLPVILTKGTGFVGAVAAGLAGLAFVISFSISLVIHNVDRFISHGLEFEKLSGGQKTTYKLIQTNPIPHRLPKGQQPNVTVGPAMPNLFGKPSGGGQALPNNVTQQGRKLKPEERQAPGKNPLHNNLPRQEELPLGLGVGERPRLSKDDPLAVLDDTQAI